MPDEAVFTKADVEAIAGVAVGAVKIGNTKLLDEMLKKVRHLLFRTDVPELRFLRPALIELRNDIERARTPE